ncbi:MAG: hypothetical protein GX660_18700 [Clostridiaceae bacterium]|nr:hypothetical protein [Clostridiaceae bacterium]
MNKKGNTFYFTLPEKRTIKSLIDKKYGHETTPSHYDSKGYNDYVVENDIEKCTGKHLSGSTLERLVGLRENENNGVSIPTLIIVAEYLNFDNYERFLKFLEHYSGFRTKSSIQFEIADIVRHYSIQVIFPGNKSICLKYLNENKFEVITSINSKLQTGDKLEVTQLHMEEELICAKVKRKSNNKNKSLGQYKSGDKNPIKSIELIKVIA